MPQAKNAPAASFDSLQSELDQKFAYPASSKTYIAGSRPDIRVPMRTIKQTATRTDKGEMLNPPVPVYDTSGPYSDPDVHIDLKAGLARCAPSGSTSAAIRKSSRACRPNTAARVPMIRPRPTCALHN